MGDADLRDLPAAIEFKKKRRARARAGGQVFLADLHGLVARHGMGNRLGLGHMLRCGGVRFGASGGKLSAQRCGFMDGLQVWWMLCV